MKLENKHWIIIGVVLAIIAVWYFFLRKKKVESGYAGMYGSFGNESNFKKDLKPRPATGPGSAGTAGRYFCDKRCTLPGGNGTYCCGSIIWTKD